MAMCMYRNNVEVGGEWEEVQIKNVLFIYIEQYFHRNSGKPSWRAQMTHDGGGGIRIDVLQPNISRPFHWHRLLGRKKTLSRTRTFNFMHSFLRRIGIEDTGTVGYLCVCVCVRRPLPHRGRISGVTFFLSCFFFYLHISLTSTSFGGKLCSFFFLLFGF